MNINNRMSDVVKLRCNVCQEFLKLVIVNDWKDKLYSIAENQVKNNRRYKEKYISIYNNMRDKRIYQYSIDEMDVTAIAMITIYCNDITTASKKTKAAIRQLSLDRNTTNHSCENEPEEELYLRGILSLYNLRDFIRTVDNYETSISDSVRHEFRIKSIQKIEDLKDKLDEERIELVQINKQMNKKINMILNGEIPLNEWYETLSYYRKQDRLVGNGCHDLEIDFLLKSSDLGVKRAHIPAAIYSSKDQKNYEYRLSLAYNATLADNDVSIAIDIVKTINSFLSKRYKHILTEKMQSIINGLIENGYPVTISNDGYILWDGDFKCTMQPINVKKYICFINQMIIKKGKNLSDNEQEEIQEYTDNGFPITQDKDGIYLWEGEYIQMEIKPVMIAGKEAYIFD